MSMPPGHVLTESPDLDAAIALLRGMYWTEGKDDRVLRRSWQRSRQFGVVDAGGRLVACARVVTDGERFAWLSDVAVAADRRGQGLGQALVGAILDDACLGRVERFLLATRDAHGVYARHGFSETAAGSFMERRRS